jgi:uncharacterized membrane protein
LKNSSAKKIHLCDAFFVFAKINSNMENLRIKWKTKVLQPSRIFLNRLQITSSDLKMLDTLDTKVTFVIFTFSLFNLVEVIINHHILGLHHVKDGPSQLLFDISFLILGGLLLIVIGCILIRKSKYVLQKEA